MVSCGKNEEKHTHRFSIVTETRRRIQVQYISLIKQGNKGKSRQQEKSNTGQSKTKGNTGTTQAENNSQYIHKGKDQTKITEKTRV